MTKRFGYLCPDKHSGFRWLYRPTRLIETIAEDVAASLVHIAYVPYALLVALECGNRSHLNRRENAVIQIRFDAGESRNKLRVAATETHTPTGHVVTF